MIWTVGKGMRESLLGLGGYWASNGNRRFPKKWFRNPGFLQRRVRRNFWRSSVIFNNYHIDVFASFFVFEKSRCDWKNFQHHIELGRFRHSKLSPKKVMTGVSRGFTLHCYPRFSYTLNTLQFEWWWGVCKNIIIKYQKNKYQHLTNTLFLYSYSLFSGIKYKFDVTPPPHWNQKHDLCYKKKVFDSKKTTHKPTLLLLLKICRSRLLQLSLLVDVFTPWLFILINNVLKRGCAWTVPYMSCEQNK